MKNGFHSLAKRSRQSLGVAIAVSVITASTSSVVWADESLNKKTCIFDTIKLRLSMMTDGVKSKFAKKIDRERHPEFKSDLQFLEEKATQAKFGVVASEYDPHFKTRVFFTATAAPRADGTIPRVDPDAKALFIYFHGSGTQAASGGTFSAKQNVLASLGYSSIGFDYPWHKEGNVSLDMLNNEKFMKYLHEFIQAHRIEGQPVYLTGHSFGPSLIANYIRLYPKGVNGAELLSGPMDAAPELLEWQQNHTHKMMEFWKDTKANDKGGLWAGKVLDDSKWTQDDPKFSDPTEDPNFKLRILVGQDEEYIPKELDENGLPKKGTPLLFDFCARLKQIFKNAICTVEPGTGHLLFSHKDANGHDVITRELMALNGDDISKAKEMKKALPARTEVDLFAQNYRRDPIFQKWFDDKYGHEAYVKMVNEKDFKAIKVAQTDWRYIVDRRNAELLEHIKNTKEWAPEFYQANKADIDALDPTNKQHADNKIVKEYRAFLNTQDPEILAKYATASDQIFVAPEKTAKADRPQNGEKRGKPNKAPVAEQETAAAAKERKPSSLDYLSSAESFFIEVKQYFYAWYHRLFN